MTYEFAQPSVAPGSQPVAPARNLLGVVAFVVGLVGLVLRIVVTLGLAFLVRSVVGGTYNLVSWTGAIVVGLIGLTALVLGIVALLKRGAPKGFAAAGAVLGGEAVLVLVLTIAQDGILSLLYQ